MSAWASLRSALKTPDSNSDEILWRGSFARHTRTRPCSDTDISVWGEAPLVLLGAPGAGKSSLFALLLNELLGAGFSRRKLRNLAHEDTEHLRENSLDADVDHEVWGRLDLRGGLHHRPMAVGLDFLPSWASRCRQHSFTAPRPLVVLDGLDERQNKPDQPIQAITIDPCEALVCFLQRLVKLNRRAHFYWQSAMQRLTLAWRTIVSSPHRPPGEIVVSSARAPRGPDVPRVTSTPVLVPRGKRPALV